MAVKELIGQETLLKLKRDCPVLVVIPNDYGQKLVAADLPPKLLSYEFSRLNSLFRFTESEQQVFVNYFLESDLFYFNLDELFPVQRSKVIETAIERKKWQFLSNCFQDVDDRYHPGIIDSLIEENRTYELMHCIGFLSIGLQKKIITTLITRGQVDKLIPYLEKIAVELHGQIFQASFSDHIVELVGNIGKIDSIYHGQIIERAITSTQASKLASQLANLDVSYHEMIIQRIIEQNNLLDLRRVIDQINLLNYSLQKKVVEASIEARLFDPLVKSLPEIDEELHTSIVDAMLNSGSANIIFYRFGYLDEVQKRKVLEHAQDEDMFQSLITYLIRHSQIFTDSMLLNIGKRIEKMGGDATLLRNYIKEKWSSHLRSEISELEVQELLSREEYRELLPFVDQIPVKYHLRIVELALDNYDHELIIAKLDKLDCSVHSCIVTLAIEKGYLVGDVIKNIRALSEKLRQKLIQSLDFSSIKIIFSENLYPRHYYAEMIEIICNHPERKKIIKWLKNKVFLSDLQFRFLELDKYHLNAFKQDLIDLCDLLDIKLEIDQETEQEELPVLVSRPKSREHFAYVDLIPEIFEFELNKYLSVRLFQMANRYYRYVADIDNFHDRLEFFAVRDRAAFLRIQKRVRENVRKLYLVLKEYLLNRIITELSFIEKTLHEDSSLYRNGSREEIKDYLFRARSIFTSDLKLGVSAMQWVRISELSLEMWEIEEPSLNSMIGFIDRCIQIQHDKGLLFDGESRMHVIRGYDIELFLDFRRKHEDFDSVLKFGEKMGFDQQIVIQYKKMHQTLERLRNSDLAPTRPLGSE